jgi:hypothetical protein
MRLAILALIGALPCGVFAQQHKVDLQHMYERVLCVVPMVGAGTYDDPRRPMFAPVRPDPNERSGILGFSYQVSDDGNFALVEFVARDRAALSEILSAKRSDVKAFEKGKARRPDIEAEFRKYRKDFDLDKFRGVGLP